MKEINFFFICVRENKHSLNIVDTCATQHIGHSQLNERANNKPSGGKRNT